jgi:gluconolactonase
MNSNALKAFLAAACAAFAAAPACFAGDSTPANPPHEYPAMGSIERLDPALDELIAPDAKIEKLAGGFEWAEGPVWDRKTGTLLFSDVPRNVIFQWKEGTGTRDYIYPSGYTGSRPREGNDSEQGSNGLTLDAEGRLVLCQHGDRRVARLEPDKGFTTLAQYCLDRRFNSPNDLVFASNGNLYFTDPTYGLPHDKADPNKLLGQELLFSGVYLRRPNGKVELLTKELSYPNGVALSPQEKMLYVAVSDPDNPVIMAYPIRSDGTLDPGHVFFDAKPLVAGRKGLPDGLKVDRQGNVFATGPGGVLVLSPQGKLLGTVNTGEATANCGWGDADGTTLYITADDYLCRVTTLTQGTGNWPKLKKGK